MQAYSEEKKKFNLKLRIYRKELFDVIIPFVKRKGFLINGFQYHDTKTKKNETIEFYGYYYLLENFGFRWTYPTLEFEYNITLSSDKKSS